MFFRSSLLVFKKFSFSEENWALSYNSIKFWDFLDIFQFHKILSLKSFGNLKGNPNIPCLLLIIMLRLWWKESLIKHQKISKYYDHDCSYLICFVHFHPAGGNFHLFPVDFGPARPGYSYYLDQICGNLHIEPSGDVTSHRMEQGLSD